MRFTVVVLMFLLVPAAAFAQGGVGAFSDISSGAQGPPPGGISSSIAAGADGTLYASGRTGVSRWTGAAWVPFGTPLAGVRTLALAPDGTLYAAEEISPVRTRVRRWTGTAWVSIGPEFDGHIFAFAFGPNETIYAGGAFTRVGSVMANSIARWDGTSWRPLGQPFVDGVLGDVNALLLTPGGTLIVGGGFYQLGDGTDAYGLAIWDGSQWFLPEGGGVSGDIRSILRAPDGSGYYIAGSFLRGKNVPPRIDNVGFWGAQGWRPLGGGLDGAVDGLAFGADGKLYANGTFTASGATPLPGSARFDTQTQTWQPLGTGSATRGGQLVVAPDGALYASGVFVSRWDGTSWSFLGSSFGGPVRALVTLPDGDVAATGQFEVAGGARALGISVRRDGAWTALGDGIVGIGDALASGPGGALYVGGRISQAGGMAVGNIARWDGTSWSRLSSGVNGRVLALATAPDGTLYAGGEFTMAGGTAAQHVARWDGTAWSPLGDGLRGDVAALAVGLDGTLYASGPFYNGPGVSSYGFARWNGTEWLPIGDLSGNSATAKALLVGRDGSLYAGLFAGSSTPSRIGPVAVRGIARWNGTSWSALGPVTGTSIVSVVALAETANGDLYAGGSFSALGGTVATNVAQWNGTVWSALGSGVGALVNALAAEPGGRVVIGGGFTAVGPVVSPYVVAYDRNAVADDPSPEPADAVVSLRIAPNPARGTSSLRVTHPAGHATVDVFDTLGRRVARAFDGEAPAGEHRITLDVSRLTPGAYVVRLAVGGHVETRPLVVVR